MSPAAIVLALPMTEPDILLHRRRFRRCVDMFEVAKSALAARPELAVVMLSSDGAPERLRAAMFAGAEEYLIKPIDGPALRASLGRYRAASHAARGVERRKPLRARRSRAGLGRGRDERQGRAGQNHAGGEHGGGRGGRQRQNIGFHRARSGRRRGFAQPQPESWVLFDLSTAEANQRAEGGYTVDWMNQFATKHKSGLSYLQWEGSNSISPEGVPDDFLIALFDTCRRAQSVTFVDFGLLTPDEATQMFPMLDVILVVSSSSDLLALRATKTFLDLIPEELAPRVRVIINRSDATDMISRDDYEMALEDKYKIAAVLPNEPQVAAQSINMGSPFVLTQPTSELATTVRQLAQVLFRLPIEADPAKPKRRFTLFG